MFTSKIRSLLFSFKSIIIHLSFLFIVGIILSFLNGLSASETFAASLKTDIGFNQPLGVTSQSLSSQSVDLEASANQAETAAEEIYQGLDQTKEFIGKTEDRKQIIEKARDRASSKLEKQAERARSLENPASLNPNEINFLKQIQD